MSLIVGQYYRGDPKQKPKQWGSFSAVQRSLFLNAEKIGINPDDIVLAMPMWGPGTQVDFSKNANFFENFGVSYERNGLRPTAVTSRLSASKTIPYHSNICTIQLIFDSFSAGINNVYGKLVDTGSVTSIGSNNSSTTLQVLIDSQNASVTLPDSTGNNLIVVNDGGYLPGRYMYVNDTLRSTGNYSRSVYGDLTILNRSAGDRAFDGILYNAIILSSALNRNQISELSVYPYQLWQAQALRTYFDLSASGTTLSFSNINSISTLNNDILSAIRLLNPNNISCFTEISDSIISGLVNIINGNDLSNDSQITQAAVQAIRKLLVQEISSLSQITNVSLQAARKVGLTDIEALTEVTTIVFSVIRQLAQENIASLTQITNSSITTGRNIFGEDISITSQILSLAIAVVRKIQSTQIESISEITDVVLSITGGISGIDVESQTEITSLVLSILRALKENNVESNSSINEATLNVIHQLDFNNISSLSEITDLVIVAGSNIGINDNNSLTQITQVILDIIKAVSPININIQSEIDNPVISVLRTLFSSTVNIVSNVTSVGVTNISTSVTGKVTITFSMATPSNTFSMIIPSNSWIIE